MEAIQGLPAAISLEAAAILAVAVAIHPVEADPALVPLKVPTSVGFLLPVGPLLSQALRGMSHSRSGYGLSRAGLESPAWTCPSVALQWL